MTANLPVLPDSLAKAEILVLAYEALEDDDDEKVWSVVDLMTTIQDWLVRSPWQGDDAERAVALKERIVRRSYDLGTRYMERRTRS
jgi:hypothetical protein